MLRVTIKSKVLNVVMVSVILLNVAAPYNLLTIVKLEKIIFAIFKLFWGFYNKTFYEPNFH
jgi:hypothetical protein